jgi:septal ring factor EnvC (AmiA/AmiB activator)
MNNPTTETNPSSVASEQFGELEVAQVAPENTGSVTRDRDVLAMLTALCLAAPHTTQPPKQRAAEALGLAKTLLATLDADSEQAELAKASEDVARPELALARGSVGAAMLARQVGELNTRCASLQAACDERSGERDKAVENLAGAEQKIRDLEGELAEAKRQLSGGTSGPAPRPPKKAASESKAGEG